MNFTLQDILGVLFAFFVFPVTIIFPGYVIGQVLDLFDFKQRSLAMRFGIGLILSFVISPIVLHLTSSLLSFNFALLTLTVFSVMFTTMIVKERNSIVLDVKSHFKPILWVVFGWAIFVTLSLVNIQWGERLFYSVTSFDQTTRVAIIEAMTRTGIPPVNPSYYPGQPVPLTFVYYFWYIPCSMVDAIGGQLVDARAALNASSIWAGIGMMAAVAFYLRQRNVDRSVSVSRSAWSGIGLLAVSGLDILPIIFLMLRTGKIVGSVDVWNTWIPSWVASVLWAPHHVAALVAGLGVMMLAQSARGLNISRQFVIFTIAGLGLASTLGLSVYVTFVFVIFWGLWLIAIFLQKTERGLILPMIFSGIVAIILAAPFLLGLIAGVGGSGDAPVAFEVRTFLQLESFVKDWPPVARSLIMLAVLPINYIFELGFFFMAGLYWLRMQHKNALRSNPFFVAEILLLLAALLIGSVLRSTLIASNDLGWRAWLPGQFILLIWGVDVWGKLVTNFDPMSSTNEAKKDRKLLQVFLLIGLLTTIMDSVLLRTAWPLMTGPAETARYYDARLVYEYLRDHVPADVITQNNPLKYVDRPSGLYGTHQMTISDRTIYGVPENTFEEFASGVGRIFFNQDEKDWQVTDSLCRKYFIEVLIVEDLDPFWKSIPALRPQRAPLYENERFAVFSCGAYQASRSTP